MHRRKFLTGSATAITLFAFRLPTGVAESGIEEANAFLDIEPDGAIVVKICQAEMGQGISTGLAMALAEELRVPLDRVRHTFVAGRSEYNNRALSPDEQITGGSRSMQAFFDIYRRAGASAREKLIAAAAKRWRVAASDCIARDGSVVHTPSRRSIRYLLLAAAAARQPAPADLPLTERSAFRLIGTSPRRVDTREKADGSAIFGIDVKVPGMVHAAIRHSPVVGAEVVRYEAGMARSVPGVINVIPLPGAIAAVADHYWQAVKALELIEVEFSPTPRDTASSNTVSTALRAALAFDEAAVAFDEGAAPARIAASGKRVEAEYEVPFLAHATLEPVNATAYVSADGCKVWAPTQAPTRARNAAAMALGLAPGKVAVVPTYVGGGFGIKGRSDVVVEAALLSRAVKRPVKLIWSREEDMRQDFYRPAYAAHLSASIGEDGLPDALSVRLAGSGPLTYARPDLTRNGIDPISVRDLVDLWYGIGSRRVETAEIAPPVRVGFWRSTGASQNVFFIETFIDEIAHAAHIEPFAMRRRLLAHDLRSQAVLERAARESGWTGAADPGRFRGMAFFAATRWKCRVALVAEIANRDDHLVPSRIVCAADVGLAVNPALVRSQLEGGILFGLTAALYGEITLEKGTVKQGNFDDYPMLRMAQAPEITVHLIEGDDEPGSVGEIGVPAVAPALANAVFAATGKRVRRLPIGALAS